MRMANQEATHHLASNPDTFTSGILRLRVEDFSNSLSIEVNRRRGMPFKRKVWQENLNLSLKD